MQPRRAHFPATTSFAISVILLLTATLTAKPTEAQNYKFKVLHTFHGPNGAFPTAQLVRDAEGNLYGTTASGGRGSCKVGNMQNGCGTVFKLDKNGKQVWLYNFRSPDGSSPEARLLLDMVGNLYGTTAYGGDLSCLPSYGCGTVFKLDKNGKKETVLYKFKGAPDGEDPFWSPLVLYKGAYIGTTGSGGASTYGTVFKLKAGRETVLHSFAGPPGDGQSSGSGVIGDGAGNFYVVTGAGGSYSGGTMFKIDSTGAETILYNFSGRSDGGGPSSVLLMDSGGNLYGTTQGAGSFQGVCEGQGCGVVFKLSPQSGGNWVESTVYAFNGTDGQRPIAGPLVMDANGNLYGTTYFGGTSQACNGTCGVVFKIDPAGNETVLYNFTGGADGADPFGGLTIDKAGNLYGMTELGGDHNCKLWNGQAGCGVVFEITPGPWPGGTLSPDPISPEEAELGSIWADTTRESAVRPPLLAFRPSRLPVSLRIPGGGLSLRRSCGSKPAPTTNQGGL